MDDMKLITCVLTSKHGSDVESLKQILTVGVKKDQVVVDHQLEEEKNSHSTNLKVVFVAKCGGKYLVSASMYGEMVQGSPMVVDVALGSGAKKEGVQNNVKLVNDDNVIELKDRHSWKEVKEDTKETEARYGKDDLYEREVAPKGDAVSVCTVDLAKTDTSKVETVGVDETNARADECSLKPSSPKLESSNKYQTFHRLVKLMMFLQPLLCQLLCSQLGPLAW